MKMIERGPDFHCKHFAEFCKWELASGGPDPQLAMVHHMATTGAVTEEEHLWRALCYIGPYNVPYGEVLWLHWPLENIGLGMALHAWLDEAFEVGKITTRNERKTVRTPAKMHAYLMGAYRFVRRDWQHLKTLCATANNPRAAYEDAWAVVLELPHVGRYAAIKLIEYMRRYLGLKVTTPDIRPKDAWSPRYTLGWLYPDRGLGNRDNSASALLLADQSCRDALSMLHHDYGIDIDMFQLQVLLCEYRESYESRKQYPGRSLDSELKYALRAEAEWGHTSTIWQARKFLFPNIHLGELRSWAGPRKDVGCCLRDNGYTWSDIRFDYNTTSDMANPHKWAGNHAMKLAMEAGI